MTKHSPTYGLKLRCKDTGTSSGGEWQEQKIEAPFAKWFTEDGYLVGRFFQQWLASEVLLVKKAQREFSEK